MSAGQDELRRAALLRAAESLQDEAAARCKRMEHCVEWDSITWRYGVLECDKEQKTKGRCLCEERRNFLAHVSRSKA